ncbi:shikimate dehydrogenase [Haloferula chungangensis]|uniref:Shikimate dehydrogenase (NADP(+)) n=1 Tax=Haloferula chungangensis TaxID=1048331 RepID=A0ABW2LC87_9BACT
MTVHSLTDLASRDLLDAGHSKPARLAVIGHPVAHSASPRMHQPALDEAGIDARYIALDIEPGQVAEAFKRMRELGFIGCNVTVPHKFDALAACDEIDDAARTLGAVNTVRFDDDATRGSNTDGYGFEHAVKESLNFDLAGKSVLIVGAGGGAGGAIAAHCVRSDVARLILVNRTLSKIESLAERLTSDKTEIITLSSESMTEPSSIALAHSSDLLVNTASLGLKEGDPSPLPEACFTSRHFVFDTIYSPPVTSFIRAGRAVEARTANGAGMLLHQGVRAFEIWFPGSTPTEAMRQGLSSAQTS